jgi:hypothetical protein
MRTYDADASETDFRYICLRRGLQILMPQMRAYDADAASEAYDTYASDEGFRC